MISLPLTLKKHEEEYIMEIYMNRKEIQRGNCSTVIIGKDVSLTGNILMGHN